MTDPSPLVNIGEFAKPATVLIEKVSEAVGGIFKPVQIKRIARAEAEAALISARSSIQVTELHHRALERLLIEEARKQENIESITSKALPHVEESAAPEKVDSDWLAGFFDKCRIVSDEQMQELWGRVLAGEANRPGSFSKRTVQAIAALEKDDAVMFASLCRFGWWLGDMTPLIYDIHDAICAQNGVTFSTLRHLDAIGLITFNNISGFRRIHLPRYCVTAYFNEPFVVEFQKDVDNDLETGHVMLTKTGVELARISEGEPVAGLVELVLSRWRARGCTVSCPFPKAIASIGARESSSQAKSRGAPLR